jgi:eukaryotic-like serine/threonine-protein kinase
MSPLSCPRCGAALPAHAPEGLCPACVLSAIGRSTLTRSATATDALGAAASAGATTWEPRFEPGDRFGPYRIDAFMGRGGMGEVYEAEHLAQGRRVALKVLHHRLRRSDDRGRFLAEGRLAAAVTHPHCVYVFETEEIGGIPVIAMEFVSGGTLKDRVATGAPLRPAEAVDAILQVVDGLEAAHAAGVLHRDVKPSNCFVDRDGLIKVGDFGLSISTGAPEVSAVARRASFEGTPQFAAPEQIAGDALDVRADIYSVGATLYFLLTGHPPFDDRDLDALLTRIRTEPARFPLHRPSPVPSELAAVVHRCLAKQPASRPGTYAELKQALAPFASTATVPAPVGLRLAATVFDLVIMAPLVGVLLAVLVSVHVVRSEASVVLLALTVAVLYWGACEGIGGATYGKHRCGLRVISADGRAPGVARAFARSALCALPLGLFIGLAGVGESVMRPSLAAWLPLAASAGVWASLLMPARRQNGCAGLHDLLTGTRVVKRAERLRPPATPAARRAHDAALEQQHGPYRVDAEVGATDTGRIHLAWDPRLQRAVWIHVRSPAARSVSSVLRNVSRPGRLHWLTGRRAASGNWDAYDALDGQPLLGVAGSQPWSAVSVWLSDLARELVAGMADDSLDAVALDRVWITADGRGKLLDFRAPGLPAGASAMTPLDATTAQRFLDACARTALGAPVPPLPLSVSACLGRLEHGAFRTLQEVVTTLDQLQATPDHVTPTVRGMTLALGVVVYLFTSVALGHLLGSGVARSLASASLDPFWLPDQVYGRIACAVLGLLCACALRSGVWLRAFGVAVVTSDGVEVSRARAVWRAAWAWSWVPLQLVATAYGRAPGSVAWLTALGLLYAATNPARGLQDRLAGTYLVPR